MFALLLFCFDGTEQLLHCIGVRQFMSHVISKQHKVLKSTVVLSVALLFTVCIVIQCLNR